MNGKDPVNRVLVGLTRRGVSVFGARLLEVRGRTSGVTRTAVVNVLEHDGARWLVAPRGQTQWVRNLRAAREGTIRLGRKVETCRAQEIDDADKTPVLRAYLAKWGFEVGTWFPELSAKSSDADWAAVAGRYPVFRLRF